MKRYKKISYTIFLLICFLLNRFCAFAQWPGSFPNSAYQFPNLNISSCSFTDCIHDNMYVKVPGEIIVRGSVNLAPRTGVFKAGKSITLNPGTLIHQQCGVEQITLSIDKSGCDIVFINAPDGHVKKNEKLELGIKLHDDELEGINNYLNETGTDPINPFKPLNPLSTDQDYMDVVAHFTSPTGKHIKVFGFFYRDYKENNTDNIWEEKPSDYPFRIRFSPNEVGNWTVLIDIRNRKRADFNLGIDPNCTSNNSSGFICEENPDNLGPLIIGSHGTYLAHRDEQGDGTLKSFFAIGANVPQPWHNDHISQCDFIFCRDDYMYHQNGIDELHQTGANTNRLFTSGITWSPQSDNLDTYPWNAGNAPDYIVNSGKPNNLGNYDNRQPQMFELDKILSKCHEWNMYTILDLFSYSDFANENAFNGPGNPPAWYSYLPDWTRNPYKSSNQSMIPDINNQVDFFNNAVCREYIKRQIRYFIARWGYDSHILCYEIFNEVDNGVTPYPNSQGYRAAIFSWQSEMSAYIKNIDNNNHLVTTNYAGMPVWPDDKSLREDPNIDIIAIHSYSANYDVDRIERVKQVKDNLNALVSPKPFIDDEGGSSGSPSTMESRTNSPYHNFIWSSLFEGGFGGSLNFWWDATNDIEGQKDLKSVVSFMRDVDFEQNDFKPLPFDEIVPFPLYHNRLSINPTYPISCRGRLEFHALANSIGTRAMGWVRNRTVYWGSLSIGPQTPCDTLASSTDDQIFYFYCPETCTDCHCDCSIFHGIAQDENSQHDDCTNGDIQEVEDETLQFIIPNGENKLFTVDWYAPGNVDLGTEDLSGPVKTDNNVSTTASGLIIIHPPITNAANPDFAFKIREVNTGSFKIANPSSELNENNQNKTLTSIIAYPNPSHSKMTFQCRVSTNIIKSIIVRDALGNEVSHSDNVNKNKSDLDISFLNSGIYVVNILLDDNTWYFKKIVKQ